jgi:Holliday junction DNA helicase RuvA
LLLIASLKGSLLRKSPEAVVIEANGVGYEVLVPLSTLYALPDAGSQVQLMIHTHVRENQFLLVGFLGQDEKEAFRFLTMVNGIGPRLAVNILSGLPANELLEAIVCNDTQRLQRIPGVGKKMAERIVVELKDRIPPREWVIAQSEPLPPEQKELYLEVLSALMNLGYKRKESEKAIQRSIRKESDPEHVRLEALLKSTLRELVKEP